MNSATAVATGHETFTASNNSNPGGRAWCFFIAILIMGTSFVVLAVWGLGGYFRLSPDVKTLRDSVLKAPGARWQKQFQLHVGPVTTRLTQTGLSLVDLDPEPLAAVQALRAGEVAVYHLTSKRFNPSAIMAAADTAMASSAWPRAVAVVEDQNLVVVYTPSQELSPRQAQACVLVISDRQMIIASVRGNLEPLLQMLTEGKNASKWRKHSRKNLEFF